MPQKATQRLNKSCIVIQKSGKDLLKRWKRTQINLFDHILRDKALKK